MVAGKKISLNKGNGFTLVELLVVIAIIALLLSILMPTLNKVRASGKEIVCKSNMHNIGTAGVMYMSDHRGTIHPAYYIHPEYAANPNADPEAKGWHWILQPYIPTKGSYWKCPDDKSKYLKSYLVNISNAKNNKNPSADWLQMQGPVNKKLAVIKNPAITIIYTCSSLPGIPVPANHTVFDFYNCTWYDQADYLDYPPYVTTDFYRRPHTVKDEARVLALLDCSVVKVPYVFGGRAKWAWDIGADKYAPRKPK